MSASRSLFRWPLLWLTALVVGTFACSDATTEPVPHARALAPPPPSAARAYATRPMKISAEVLVDEANPVIPPPAPCLQLFNSVIKGTATHLGQFEGVGSTCVLDVVAPDPDPPFLPPGPAPYATATFSNPLWVLTAANGDELWLEALDAVFVSSLTDGSSRAEGTHTIIGGTGRFEGATGELDSPAVNSELESRGWIRY